MRTFDKSDTTDRTGDGNSGPIETMGRTLWSLQSLTKSAGAGPTATVKLEGSNDGVNWNPTALITNSHTANEQKFGTAVDVAWRFVRVTWSGFNNLTVDEWHLHAQGSPNTA